MSRSNTRGAVRSVGWGLVLLWVVGAIGALARHIRSSAVAFLDAGGPVVRVVLEGASLGAGSPANLVDGFGPLQGEGLEALSALAGFGAVHLGLARLWLLKELVRQGLLIIRGLLDAGLLLQGLVLHDAFVVADSVLGDESISEVHFSGAELVLTVGKHASGLVRAHAHLNVVSAHLRLVALSKDLVGTSAGSNGVLGLGLHLRRIAVGVAGSSVGLRDWLVKMGTGVHGLCLALIVVVVGWGLAVDRHGRHISKSESVSGAGDLAGQ